MRKLRTTEFPVALIGETGYDIGIMDIVDHLASKFGSQKRVALAAECAQQTVAGWKEENRVPSKRIELLLKNAPKFGVDLTPDDFFPDVASAPEQKAGAA